MDIVFANAKRVEYSKGNLITKRSRDMKKKLLALVLSLGMAFTIAQPATTYAADDAATIAAIASAETKKLDEEYSVTWDADNEECWSRITLKKQGILNVDLTHPKNNTLGYIAIRATIYDENENCIFYLSEESDEEKGEFHIGLDEGTYYVKLTPQYSSYVYGKTSSYKFSLTKDKHCEIEWNNDKESATDMTVGYAYTGYLGSGFSSLNDYRDNEDLYAVTLKKGQLYKFTFDNAQGTTIVKLRGEDVDLDDLWPSLKADDFCTEPGTTFAAPYSGTYYLHVYNYSNEQFKYTTKIENVTPKATSITEIKAGKKTAAVSWKTSRGAGYQVQYSLTKDFKSAKSVKVSANLDSTKIKKLTSGKTYYVRVRAYTKYENSESKDAYKYSSWSKVQTVEAK